MTNTSLVSIIFMIWPIQRTLLTDPVILSLQIIYSLIAFDERVIFWLQRVRSLPCACAYVALFARRLAYNHYAITHAYNAANTHAQGSDPACWSQKVTLSRRRQSEYSVQLCIGRNRVNQVLHMKIMPLRIAAACATQCHTIIYKSGERSRYNVAFDAK